MKPAHAALKNVKKWTCPKCGAQFKKWGGHPLVCGIDQTPRFWAKVDKNGPGGCWLYTGAKSFYGYGFMQNPIAKKPKFINAHKLSWLLLKGPIPDGLHVLHKCDVTACCNPDHLFLGTAKANAEDKVAKKRHVYGERTPGAKLTEDDVRQIRKDFVRTSYKFTNADVLAARYGVGKGTILNAALRKKWKHVV